MVKARTAPSEPMFNIVTGGGSKGIQPKLLPCASKSPTYLGMHV